MRLGFVVAFLGLAALSSAEEAYLGLYIGGKKIGYTTYVGTVETLDGKSVKRSDSRMVMSTSMMGSDLDMKMDSSSWSTVDGKPVKMFFRIESGGRVQTIDAKFDAKKVKLVIDNSGQVSNSEIALPTGAPIVDDALGAFLINGVVAGAKKDFFVLDPTTVSFVKNTAEVMGKSTIKVDGKNVVATLVTIHDPRADTSVFLDDKGEFLRGEGPMGIVMLPETKESALNMKGGKPGEAKVDISEATSIHPDKTLENPGKLRTLTIRVQGRDLTGVPTDSYQTVTGTGKSWTMAIHPPSAAKMLDPNVSNLKSSLPSWVKPSMHIDSDSVKWRPILAPIIANKPNLRGRVTAIHDFVFKRMTPNGGIGVLRDAEEVYRTKEGVCRDYAILTATLMRASGIPARLASGLVSWDGTFYYHAWVEVWDSKGWYPIDSTSPDIQVSAAHVKLSEGNVEQAFSFPFLGSVKIQVLDARR